MQPRPHKPATVLAGIKRKQRLTPAAGDGVRIMSGRGMFKGHDGLWRVEQGIGIAEYNNSLLSCGEMPDVSASRHL
jgi:hypothetical protein